MHSRKMSEQRENSLKELQLRLFILSSIPVFIIWGMVVNDISPNTYDPLWIRLMLSIGALTGIAASYFVKSPFKYLNWLLFTSAYFLTFHSYYLMVLNQFFAFPGTVMIIAVVLQALPTKKSTAVYVGINLFLSILACILNLGSQHREVLFLLSYLATILPGFLFKYYSFRTVEFLKQSESEKARILQFMSDGLMLIDKNGEMISHNPAASRILNINSDKSSTPDDRSKRWRYLDSDGNEIKESDTPVFITLRTGKPLKNYSVGMESKITHKTKWLNVSTTPIFQDEDSQEVKGVLVSFSDISDLKSAQRKITESQMQMAAASKLTSLGEMASGIAHEINNPLAIIQSKIFQVSKILDEKPEYYLAKDHLTKIEQTIFRIQKIVKGLRSFARQADKDPFESVSLKTIIDDTLGLCGEKLAKSNIVVTVDVDPKLQLDCRPGQISQILMNLLQNATDAIGNGSRKRINIKASIQNHRIYISVSDTGSGIPENIKNKIMQPFFTTKEVGKGTGLGLSISMGIARQHHGNLYLDNNSDLTCFILELPVEQNKNIDDFQVA